MPEGDSYVRAAARIRPVLENQVVSAVSGVPAVRRHGDRVRGATVTAVRTIGKHLLIDLSTGWTIQIWLGMAGRVLAIRSEGRARSVGERPVGHDRGAVRLTMETAVGRVEVWSAPTVDIERTRVVAEDLARLGPDILDVAFDWERFSAALSTVDRTRPVGDVLTDQRVIAGIGNEYRNELLFLERIHPATPVGELTTDQVERLVRRAMRLMSANLGPGRRNTTGDRRSPTWVYGRGGRPCRRCRTAIRVTHTGAPPRITYWCPGCQATASPDN